MNRHGILLSLFSTGVFRFVACPHYTAEVLIYISLGCLQGWTLQWTLLTAFVAANLSTGAVQVCGAILHRRVLALTFFCISQTLKWYREQDDRYVTPFAIFPGLL